MSNQYIAFAEGIKSRQLVMSNTDILSLMTNKDGIDYYTSVFNYNDYHFEKFNQTGTLAGITDVTTNRLVFDFDSSSDLGASALVEARVLVNRLLEYGIPKENLLLAFSGQKGFGIELNVTQSLNPTEVKLLVTSLVEGLDTADKKIYDPQRIIRFLGSKHLKSGLYKIPLRFETFMAASIEQIRNAAKTLTTTFPELYKTRERVTLPSNMMTLTIKSEPKKPIVEASSEIVDIDWTKRPKWMIEAKYALQHGYFNPGERNHAYMILASTYKNQGISDKICYRMLKGVDESYCSRTGKDKYSTDELWNNITKVVYSENWKGGMYSPETDDLLKRLNKDLGLKSTKEDSILRLSDLGGDHFKRYADSFYETRIYTGLRDLDEAFPLCAGTNVGIVGAASSGKTALAINILKQMKENGGVSVFASLDMSKSRFFEKLLYNVTKGEKSRDDLYNAYRKGEGKQYDELVNREFPNTFVFTKSSPTVTEMADYLNKVQDSTGKPVRLLLVDYFERLGSSKSDDTAASKDVASGIQDLLSDFPELTPITLYQPNKFALGGGPESPILNYASIKGSSFIFQACRQILSLWRPFFNPDYSDWDKYVEMAVLKNDLGECGKFKYNWYGKTGEMTPMTPGDLVTFNNRVEQKKQMDNKTDEDDL